MAIDFLKMPLPSKKKVEIEMEPAEDGASEMGEEEMMPEEEVMDNIGILKKNGCDPKNYIFLDR